jgi:hypothetical protein
MYIDNEKRKFKTRKDTTNSGFAVMREKEKKTPIRTLHLINIVLWLDDFGVLSSKMESFMTVWPYLDVIKNLLYLFLF